MSNLGKYQVMTTMAKKVGGPDVLGGIIFGSGLLCGAAVVGVIEACKKLVRVYEEAKYYNQDGTTYKIKKSGMSSDGIRFEVGDRFKIIEEYDDLVIIEIMGNLNNPYAVDASLIKDLSDYRS